MAQKCEAFEVPADVRAGWDARKRGAAAQKKWEKLFAAYAAEHPALAQEFGRRMAGELPAGWEKILGEHKAALQKAGGAQASRISSKETLDVLAPALPELFGGSADLTGSVGTLWKGVQSVTPGNFAGRYLHYGVREFAMGAIMNGMAGHGGFIPYGGTFLIFSDYAKNAIRLAALMKQRVIWVLTHDSIMVGEDGPTHQPVEQLAMLRLTPGVHVWRPCDGVETTVAWQSAVARKDGPTCLALTRQNIPVQPRDAAHMADIAKGGYILRDSKGTPEVILMASGSEVAVAVGAAEVMEKKGVKVRVVSMPCAEIFEKQEREWKEAVLPNAVRTRVAVEAAASDWWRKYVGLDGAVVGMSTFGESAPGPAVYEYFGFTVDNVLKAVKKTCASCKE